VPRRVVVDQLRDLGQSRAVVHRHVVKEALRKLGGSGLLRILSDEDSAAAPNLPGACDTIFHGAGQHDTHHAPTIGERRGPEKRVDRGTMIGFARTRLHHRSTPLEEHVHVSRRHVNLTCGDRVPIPRKAHRQTAAHRDQLCDLSVIASGRMECHEERRRNRGANVREELPQRLDTAR
jgi:hypothetical protein